MKHATTTFTHAAAGASYIRPYLELVRNRVIPYQWDALNDRVEGAEPSRAIRNFRIAAGMETGEFHGYVFQDSDVGKWIEAVGWSLRLHPDIELEARVDSVVEIIATAQQPDGYLNTYFTIKEPGKRWTNLCECHELYSAGHLLEGAVTYFQATGKRRFLDVMLRYVDLIDATFGSEVGKIHGYDGHEEIELALLRLYDVTGDERHLRLAAYFIDERGASPSFFEQEWEARGRISHWSKSVAGSPNLSYHQAHVPVRQQDVAVGHAVRAVYLYTAMADLANKTKDSELRESCERLFRNIVERQLYVTGGIGSTHTGEAFTFDYDLPNDTVYAEACASIGLAFFAQRMLEWTPSAHYADVIEQALYNTILSGMSLDGAHFFYVNPLEVWPKASEANPERHHVKVERQTWFGCACCPPNLARFLMSLDTTVATKRDVTLFVHQYLPGRVESGDACFEVATAYPREGRVELRVIGAIRLELALRIPGWCGAWKLSRNGATVEAEASADGYARLAGPWRAGETVVLDLEMNVEAVEAHPELRANAGQVCLRRGPVVYCVEEVDNGPNLSRLKILPRSGFTLVGAPGLPEGTVMVHAQATERSLGEWDGNLYKQLRAETGHPITLRAVPYHLWGNRGKGEMRVWIRH